MSDKDCRSCKWDVLDDHGAHCQQGHYRWTDVIQNCHAYQEKEKCECSGWHKYDFPFGIQDRLEITCKKCGRTIE